MCRLWQSLGRVHYTKGCRQADLIHCLHAVYMQCATGVDMRSQQGSRLPQSACLQGSDSMNGALVILEKQAVLQQGPAAHQLLHAVAQHASMWWCWHADCSAKDLNTLPKICPGNKL